MIAAYRVQAADGRGPWRPGWSLQWIDGDAPADRLSETIMDLVPMRDLRRLPSGMSYGCACRTLEALMQWFTPVEKQRLESFRFYPVRLMADVVVAETDWQMLIGRVKPFTEGATRLNWRIG